MKQNEHELKKQLPKVKEVQDLIVAKKKIHRKVVYNKDEDEVSVNSDLKQLHYSEAGRSPRLSDLGPPKEPKPKKMKTDYMQHIY